MKIFNQIFIVVIFIFLIFLVKNDYKSIYSKSISYLKSEVDKSSTFKEGVASVLNNVNQSSNFNLNKNKVETPGALVVSNNFLTNDIKDIKLSSKNVIDITNNYRAINGKLSPLVENSKLNFSAEKKLQDMFMKQYFEHVSPDGIGVGDLGNQIAYEYIIIGENLALGNFKDDQALVDAWMASPGHRANILNKGYKDIGVAVGKGIYNGKSIWMAVQHFGLPKSFCPTIDEVLRGIIDLDQKQIKEMESNMATRRAKIDSGAVYEGLTTSDQIEKYNSLILDYNKNILNIKEKIIKYNEEVRSFNSCVQEVSK